MFLRRILFVPTLAAAVGVPYLLTNKDLTSGLKARFTSSPARTNAVDGESLSAGGANPAMRTTAEVTVTPVRDLREVFRFDVNPRWVINRYARVSTSLAESDMQGLRVPLITGTEVNDLAGSLTYYFDKEQRVQRIKFHGYTGDDRPLATLVSRYCGMCPEPALGAGLYLAKWNGQPTSAMRVRHAPLMDADAPHGRLEIDLEINRPGIHYGLSPQFQQMLAYERQVKRW